MTELMLVKCRKCSDYKAKFAPRNGCAACWSVYFYSHIATSSLLLKLLDTSPDRATRTYGTEMVKQFNYFIKERNDRNIPTNNTGGA